MIIGQKMEIVKVTPSAVKKIKSLIEAENTPDLKLRMFVEGGGCSGFQYGFTFDDAANEDDFQIDLDGVTFLIDSMSSQYLQGAEVDYQESLMSSGFNIKNPNTKSTCGCGSSFTV